MKRALSSHYHRLFTGTALGALLLFPALAQAQQGWGQPALPSVEVHLGALDELRYRVHVTAKNAGQPPASPSAEAAKEKPVSLKPEKKRRPKSTEAPKKPVEAAAKVEEVEHKKPEKPATKETPQKESPPLPPEVKDATQEMPEDSSESAPPPPAEKALPESLKSLDDLAATPAAPKPAVEKPAAEKSEPAPSLPPPPPAAPPSAEGASAPELPPLPVPPGAAPPAAKPKADAITEEKPSLWKKATGMVTGLWGGDDAKKQPPKEETLAAVPPPPPAEAKIASAPPLPAPPSPDVSTPAAPGEVALPDMGIPYVEMPDEGMEGEGYEEPLPDIAKMDTTSAAPAAEKPTGGAEKTVRAAPSPKVSAVALPPAKEGDTSDVPELPPLPGEAPSPGSGKKSALPPLPDPSSMFDEQKSAKASDAAPSDAKISEDSFLEMPEAALPTPDSGEKPEGALATSAGSVSTGRVTVPFEQTETSLPLSQEKSVAAVASGAKAREGARVTIMAYAGGDQRQAAEARRVSLSRALAVRSYLIDQGLEAGRITVRAMGNKVESGLPDRVDISIE